MTIFGARPTVAAVLKHAGFDALFAFRDGRAPSDVADPSVPGVTSPDLREVA